MYSVRFDGVSKHYAADGTTALDHLDLTVDGEELMSLVGPSGCGKTTALRILAGLEAPSAGTVRLGGEDITHLDARLRHVGLVTQQNQLLNHMTAGGNIRFPLEVRPSPGPLGRSVPDRRRSPDQVAERVADEAVRFGITDLLDRRPATLSEGQRRLVQLVRAVVASPALLLMDEPLGYLEDQVRIRLRTEILRVHRERRLTTVMATAHQEDAMVMSDRIAVLMDGHVEQLGTPADVYGRPVSIDVASFFGEPRINLFRAVVRVDRGDRLLELPWRTIRAWPPVLDERRDLPIVVGVRPEHIALGVPQDEGVAAEVVKTEHLGHVTAIFLRARTGDDVRCTVRGAAPRTGTVVDVGFRADQIHLFDAVTGRALHHPG